MPTMPNVAGTLLPAAQASLQSAGVLNLATLGYFGTWPITVKWQTSGGKPGFVTGQFPAQGQTVAANSAVQLNVVEFPTGVAYP